MTTHKLETLLESLDTLVSKLEGEDIDLNESIDDYATALKETKTVLAELSTSEKKLNGLQQQNETILNQLQSNDDNL